jgi:photosystem II stability/assembly factor-like uncharacterized protein
MEQLRGLRRFYRQQVPNPRERALARAWGRITQQSAPQPSAPQHSTPLAASTSFSSRTELHLEALRRASGQVQPEQPIPQPLPSAPKGVMMFTNKRTRGLAAGATLIAVVALFALVLSATLPKHPHAAVPGSSGTPQPSVSATAPTNSLALPGGNWFSTLSQSGLQGDAPMLFPGNPRILYQNLTANTSSDINLRRSDDVGATWHALAVPGGLPAAIDTTSLFVSPLDANVVFLTLAVYQSTNPEACQLAATASNALARLSGGPTCGAQYISTDGGQHWTRQTLPIGGALGAPYGGHFENPTSEEILRVQGQRLYSAISASTVINVTFGGPSARILASDDGGNTWKLVDADLHASGQNTCDFAPTPTGSTIFALTLSESCYSSQNPSASQFLWRSDDGGAHWGLVSKLPFLAGDLALGIAPNRAAPILYAHQQQPYNPVFPPTSNATPTPVPQVRAGDPGIVYSTDGGHTWQHAPASGLAGPDTTQFYPNAATGPVGTLADGSVLGVFPTKTLTFIFAAWKPGDNAWHALTPELKQAIQVLSFSALVGADGKLTFWAITLDDNGTVAVQRYNHP